MKKVKVTLSAVLEIPDDWDIVEHEDGNTVFKTGDTYVDLDFMCLTTDDPEDGATWTLDEDLEEEFFDYIQGSVLLIEPE